MQFKWARKKVLYRWERHEKKRSVDYSLNKATHIICLFKWNMCKVNFIIIHHYISKPIRGSNTRCIAFTLDIDYAVACQPSLHENNYRTWLSIFCVNNICETRAFQQVHALRMRVTTMKLVKMSTGSFKCAQSVLHNWAGLQGRFLFICKLYVSSWIHGLEHKQC